MKKIFILFTIAALTAGIYLYVHKPVYGSPKSYELTKEVYRSGIKIIDIRTQQEWEDTGIVKGSYPITFFGGNGDYDMDIFTQKLDKIVKKDEKFALICRSGKRTAKAARILYHLGYKKVADLRGGIIAADNNDVPIVPYDPKQ